MTKDPRSRISLRQSWRNYHLFFLESPRIASQARPGQFLMVRTSPLSHPLLRRPFSIHAAEEGSVAIFFESCGLGTGLLSQKRETDTLDILGPLGKGFGLEKISSGENAALIGGGRGLAPLYFLALGLRSRGAKVRVFYGGRTKADLPLKESFEKRGFKVYASTDDGSSGYSGPVSSLFEGDLKASFPDFIFACGPEAMLKKLSKIARERNIRAEFSLESRMGCGFGACWGCVKRIKRGDEEGWRRVCVEGPVFPAEEILWQDEDR